MSTPLVGVTRETTMAHMQAILATRVFENLARDRGDLATAEYYNRVRAEMIARITKGGS